MELLGALNQHGYLTETNIAVISHFSQKWKLSSYDAVLQAHIMSEQSLADAIADIFKLDRIYSFDLDDLEMSSLRLIDYETAKRLRCCIPNRDEDGTMQAFILSPLDKDVELFLHSRSEKYRFVVLDRRLMQRALDEFYPLMMQVSSLSHIV